MIAEFRGTRSGAVALLGGGESVNDVDVAAIAREMPVIGINDSWRKLETPWMVFVDAEQTGPRPEVAFVPWSPSPQECPPFVPPTHLADRVVLIPWLHRRPEEEPRFMGRDLSRGTYAYFSGMLALEVAAWCGWTRIVLVGFDCAGAHFYDETKKTPGGSATHAKWRAQLELAKAELAGAGVNVEHRAA